MEGHETTLVIGQLAMFIIGFSAPSSLYEMWEVQAIVDVVGEGNLKRIWPNPSGFLWPSKKKLEGNQVAAISEAVSSNLYSNSTQLL